MNGGRTYKVGLIGAGYVSQYHLAALQRLPEIRIVGVCDLDATRAEALARQAQCRAFGSVEQLLEAGVEVVHVLTPPSSHGPIALQALERGCHVFLEKPVATSVEDCDRIAAAAARSGKTVGVNHSLLRDPFVLRALDLVRRGAVGEVLTVDYFRSSEYPPYPGGPLPAQYREGGFPFRDLGVHALYLLQEFLGPVQNVRAEFSTSQASNRDTNLLYDEWRVLVRCARGSGQVRLSWNVRPLQNVLIVHGTRGVVRADLFGLHVTVKRVTPLPKSLERVFNALDEARQITTQVPMNVARVACKKLLPYHGLQMMVAELYANLAAGRPAPVTPEQARPIVEWTERIAREADAAKRTFIARFPTTLTSKVLVTGATGFIGRHLVERLLGAGQRVRIFARREPAAELMNHPQVEVVVGDLGDPEAVDRAVAGTEIVYHLGAAMRGGAHDFERGTIVGTRNILESAMKHCVRKLVYISSLSVLHATAARRGSRITELWPVEPRPDRRGHYTRAKLAAEKLVTGAIQAHGLNAVILRPGQVAGAGAPLLTPAVAQRLGNRLIVLGDGELNLPLVYVEDLVDAIMNAAQAEGLAQWVFHIVDPAPVTQNELLHRHGAMAGQRMKIVHMPRLAALAAAFGVEMVAGLLRCVPPVTVYRLRSVLTPMSFDCSAAENHLGWRPRCGVQAGLAKTSGK